MNRIRHYLARRFMSAALHLLSPKPSFEGLTIMAILARLAALESALSALGIRVGEVEAKPAVDTSAFATTDSVTALADRVTAVEAEIGTEPAPAVDPAPVVDAPDVQPAQ